MCNTRLCEDGYCHQSCRLCVCEATFCPPCNIYHKCSDYQDNPSVYEYKERPWRGKAPPSVPKAPPSPRARSPGGTSEDARNQVASPKPPPQSWQRTLETIQSGPPPKATAVFRTDDDGDDVRSTNTVETHPEAASSKAPPLKAMPMTRPEGLNRLQSTALDRNPMYLPHMSDHHKAKVEAWLEAAKLYENFEAESMPLFLVNARNHPQGVVEAWREFMQHPIQWRGTRDSKVYRDEDDYGSTTIPSDRLLPLP